MLKIFFDRRSPIVYLLNFVSFIEILLLIRAAFQGRTFLGITFYWLSFTWLFLNFINLYPWYSPSPGKWGIRIHFEKNIVPASYLWAFALTLKLFGVREVWLVPIGLLFLPLFYVSIILLLFHRKDSSKMPPNYFSGNFYLKE